MSYPSKVPPLSETGETLLPPYWQSKELSHILEGFLLLPILFLPLVVKYSTTKNEISVQKWLGIFSHRISLHFEMFYSNSKHHCYWPNCPSQCGLPWAQSPNHITSRIPLLSITSFSSSLALPQCRSPHHSPESLQRLLICLLVISPSFLNLIQTLSFLPIS